jgi:hypothetical protein
MDSKAHWLGWSLIAGLGAEGIRLRYGKQLRVYWKEWRQKPKQKRHFHPRSPEDCPYCQAYEPGWPKREAAVRLCWPNCASVRIFRLKEAGVQ